MIDYDENNPEHTRIVDVTCHICGKIFKCENFFATVWKASTCDECSARLKKEDEDANISFCMTPEKRFTAIAPRSFFEGPTATNINRKGFPKEAYDAVLAWQTGYKGLLIFGKTGACKSRILFALIQRLIISDRADVEVVQGGDFRQRMIEAYRSERTEYVLNRLKKASILAWDDFGQDALGTGMETDLRAVIDYRYREALPIIITTQFTTAALTQRLSGGDFAREQVCESIIRRINERSQFIKI
jgi:DNA replication protein DnaC